MQMQLNNKKKKHKMINTKRKKKIKEEKKDYNLGKKICRKKDEETKGLEICPVSHFLKSCAITIISIFCHQNF